MGSGGPFCECNARMYYCYKDRAYVFDKYEYTTKPAVMRSLWFYAATFLAVFDIFPFLTPL